jgi:hypothetical protein
MIALASARRQRPDVPSRAPGRDRTAGSAAGPAEQMPASRSTAGSAGSDPIFQRDRGAAECHSFGWCLVFKGKQRAEGSQRRADMTTGAPQRSVLVIGVSSRQGDRLVADLTHPAVPEERLTRPPRRPAPQRRPHDSRPWPHSAPDLDANRATPGRVVRHRASRRGDLQLQHPRRAIATARPWPVAVRSATTNGGQ